MKVNLFPNYPIIHPLIEGTCRFSKEGFIYDEKLLIRRPIWFAEKESCINEFDSANLLFGLHGTKHKERGSPTIDDFEQPAGKEKMEQELEVIKEVPDYKEQDNSDFEKDLLSDDEILAAEFNCMKLSSNYEKKRYKRGIRMEIESKGFCLNSKKIKKSLQ